MSTPTVDWTVPRTPEGMEAEGLRERKKRLMRQQLSDTATQMFLERGFDAVRVTDIAEACGVSEKTVFNYFPTKESLILDRLESTVASLRTGLAEPGVSSVEAALRILDRELSAMTSWMAAQDDPAQASAMVRRFSLIHPFLNQNKLDCGISSPVLLATTKIRAVTVISQRTPSRLPKRFSSPVYCCESSSGRECSGLIATECEEENQVPRDALLNAVEQW